MRDRLSDPFLLCPLRENYSALFMVRTAIDKRSLKTRRKRASFDPNYLQAILGASAR